MSIGTPETRINSLEKSLLPSTVEEELNNYLDILEKTLKEDILNEKNNEKKGNTQTRANN